MMKFLSPIFMTFMFYNLLLIIYGPQGILASENLKKQIQELSTKIEKLEENNWKLEQEYWAIRHSPSALARESHQQGYYQKNEFSFFFDPFPNYDEQDRDQNLSDIRIQTSSYESNKTLLFLIATLTSIFFYTLFEHFSLFLRFFRWLFSLRRNHFKTSKKL